MVCEVGEASNPGPQSSSDEEPIFPGRFRPWSAESVPVPGTPPNVMDMTVADTDEESGVHEADGFVPHPKGIDDMVDSSVP